MTVGTGTIPPAVAKSKKSALPRARWPGKLEVGPHLGHEGEGVDARTGVIAHDFGMGASHTQSILLSLEQ